MAQDPLDFSPTDIQTQYVLATNACTYTDDDITGYYGTWWTGNTQVATANMNEMTAVGVGSTSNFSSGTIPTGGDWESRHCPNSLDTPQGAVKVKPTVTITSAPTGVAVVNGGAPGAHEVYVSARCDPQGQVNPQFNWSISQGSQYATLDTNYSTGPTMGVVGTAASPANGVTVSVTCTDLDTNLSSKNTASAQMTTQRPSGLAIVQPDNTTLNNCSSG